MANLLSYAGRLSGWAGVLLCAVAGGTRLLGSYHLAGYEATTLFLVGTGLMVFGCLVKLELLTSRM